MYGRRLAWRAKLAALSGLVGVEFAGGKGQPSSPDGASTIAAGEKSSMFSRTAREKEEIASS